MKSAAQIKSKMMATKERAPVAIHIRELLTRVWFLL
jgi:hypothetical protein